MTKRNYKNNYEKTASYVAGWFPFITRSPLSLLVFCILYILLYFLSQVLVLRKFSPRYLLLSQKLLILSPHILSYLIDVFKKGGKHQPWRASETCLRLFRKPVAALLFLSHWRCFWKKLIYKIDFCGIDMLFLVCLGSGKWTDIKKW